MQERKEHVLHSKTQIEHLVQDQKMDVDLLVLSIGSAHLTDTQQQCPNFCHEAATQGKKVAVINFDPSFSNAAKRLCAGQPSPDLSVYYSTLAYKDFEDGFHGYTAKEFEEFVIQFLTSKPNAQVVLAFHMYPSIPKAYKQLALREDFLTLYKDRIFFIGSYYKDCSGFVYNQQYIAKYEIYERTAYEKRLLKEQKRDTEAYQNFNPNEQFFALKNSFSSAWNSLQEFTAEGNEGCTGKTVKNDYGIDAYRELAPQTDATLGYRFISLEYLSIQTVLQSDFNLAFLAQQRAQEIESLKLNMDNISIITSTDAMQTDTALPLTSESKMPEVAVSEKLLVELEDLLTKDDITETTKSLLSKLLMAIHVLHESDSKNLIIRYTYDLLINKSCQPDDFFAYVHFYFEKAKKEGKCHDSLNGINTRTLAWDLGNEIFDNNQGQISTAPTTSAKSSPLKQESSPNPKDQQKESKSANPIQDNKNKKEAQVFKPGLSSAERSLDELILSKVQKAHAIGNLKQQKITYLKFLEHELNFGNHDKSKFATYLLNHPTHLLKVERSIFALSTHYSNDTTSMRSALEFLGYGEPSNVSKSSPSL